MMRKLLLHAIQFYQLSISPYFFRGQCRYLPSCSNYTHEAISKYGVMKGIWLGSRRLLQCNPLGKSTYDPVP